MLKDKLFELLFSTKIWILLLATTFFYIGKLSESVWMETVLIIGGLRTAAQIAEKHIGSKTKK